MSLEERWAQNQEWKNERGEIEIKQIIEGADLGVMCLSRRCKENAIRTYIVGHPGRPGMSIPLCGDHASEDSAYECFRWIMA